MAFSAQQQQSFSVLNLAKNFAKLLQIATMFYAFFSLIYWLLYTSGIPGVDSYYWIFQPAWSFVSLFYTYKPTGGDQLIDFTGVISSICLVILSNAIKSLYEVVSTLEVNHRNTRVKKLNKSKAAAKSALTSAKKSYKDLTSFIFLLDVKITSISNFIQDEKLSQETIDSLREKFHEALLNNLNHNQITQKGFFKKKLYLIYKDFDYIDNFIFYTRETLNSLSREFAKPTIRIDFLVALGSLKFNDDLNTEINVLDTIICLNLKNEFISTSNFRITYDERAKKQYRLVTKGIYNLSKNLNISNNQEIFSLRELT